MIKKGQIFIVTRGEYGDFNIEMVCRALNNFDVSEIKREYRKNHAEEYPYEEEYGNFIKWLLSSGLAEQNKEIANLYIGGYGLDLESHDIDYMRRIFKDNK